MSSRYNSNEIGMCPVWYTKIEDRYDLFIWNISKSFESLLKEMQQNHYPISYLKENRWCTLSTKFMIQGTPDILWGLHYAKARLNLKRSDGVPITLPFGMAYHEYLKYGKWPFWKTTELY